MNSATKEKKNEQAIHMALGKMKLAGLDSSYTDQLSALMGFTAEETGESDDAPEGKVPRKKISDALLYLKKKVEKKADGLRFLAPGEQPLPLTGVKGVRFYVLGPPENKKLIKDSDPNKGQAYEHEEGNHEHGDLSEETSFSHALISEGENKNKDYPFSRNYKIAYTRGEIYLLRNRIIELLSKNNFDGLDKLLQKLVVEKFSNLLKELLKTPEVGRELITLENILNGYFIFFQPNTKKLQEDDSNYSVEKRVQNSLFTMLKELFKKDLPDKMTSDEITYDQDVEGDEENEKGEKKPQNIKAEVDQEPLNLKSNNLFSLDFQLLLHNVFVLRYGINWEENVRQWVRDMLRALVKSQTKALIHLQLKTLLIRSKDHPEMRELFEDAEYVIHTNPNSDSNSR